MEVAGTKTFAVENILKAHHLLKDVVITYTSSKK